MVVTNTNISVTAVVPVQPANTATQPSASLIKPKYIKDKSVFYKKSGYLKDLLGEK